MSGDNMCRDPHIEAAYGPPQGCEEEGCDEERAVRRADAWVAKRDLCAHVSSLADLVIVEQCTAKHIVSSFEDRRNRKRWVITVMDESEWRSGRHLL